MRSTALKEQDRGWCLYHKIVVRFKRREKERRRRDCEVQGKQSQENSR